MKMSITPIEMSGKKALRCSKYFFDHSRGVSFTVNSTQALLRSQNSPFELKHWICGRFASLRTDTEKIFIRAQNFFFAFFRDFLSGEFPQFQRNTVLLEFALLKESANYSNWRRNRIEGNQSLIFRVKLV
jgi:hypothetical protein